MIDTFSRTLMTATGFDTAPTGPDRRGAAGLGWLDPIWRGLVHLAERRRTRRVLSALDDRRLRDIGITREEAETADRAGRTGALRPRRID